MPRHKVPDAWDDDWEPETATAATQSIASSPDGGAPLTAAERIARHEESNRRLWQSADAEAEQQQRAQQYFPATNNVAPAVFKPAAMKVLSRRPDNTSASEAAERAASVPQQPTPEQMRLQREEKQRRYNEARAKIFGEPSSSAAGATNSGASTPGTVTPPLSDGAGSGRNRPRGGRGAGRGGGGGGGGGGVGRGSSGNSNNNNNNNNNSYSYSSNNNSSSSNNNNNNNNNNNSSNNSNTQMNGNSSSNNNSNSNLLEGQARRAPPTRELYDPNSSSPKPRRGVQPDSTSCSKPTTPREDDQGPRVQASRAPRGPDGTGRGGFGFSKRGG